MLINALFVLVAVAMVAILVPYPLSLPAGALAAVLASRTWEVR